MICWSRAVAAGPGEVKGGDAARVGGQFQVVAAAVDDAERGAVGGVFESDPVAVAVGDLLQQASPSPPPGGAVKCQCGRFPGR